MEVKIISEDSIKPSIPTPSHLTTFNLCLLDHLIPAPYAPIVLYYPNANNNNQRVLDTLRVLKHSLSETLTRFYPLAGVIKDDRHIECNDVGAHYVTAKVNSCLYEFLDQQDNLESVSQLLPRGPCFEGSLIGSHVTSIQVNVFLCGGIAIGLCVSHRIVDGAGLNTFLRSWAAAASDSKKIVFPCFVASSLFPAPDDLWLRDASLEMWGSLFKKGKSVTKRFLFDSSAISRLKTVVSRSVPGPTRVEVVSACVWRAAMQTAKAYSDSDFGSDSDFRCLPRPSLMTHVVNLRKRAAPPFSENAMGNLIWLASARATAKPGGGQPLDLPGLVSRVRKSIAEIDDDYVSELRSQRGPDVMRETMKGIEEFGSEGVGADYFGFTSWCKIGFYEIDFGFGKPAWVSTTSAAGSTSFINLVVLMDTKSGDGIEAWVTLDEEHMLRFQHNEELLAFAVPNSNPLQQFTQKLLL